MVTQAQEMETHGLGASIPFESLNEPGTYVSQWSGHLVRIPSEALKPGHSPVLEIRGREPMFVTKLSDDPYLPLTKARMVAADLDLSVNF